MLHFVLQYIYIHIQIDVDGSGSINISELGDALAVVGLRLPAYEVRDLIRRSDTKIRDDLIDFNEFKVVCSNHSSIRIK